MSYESEIQNARTALTETDNLVRQLIDEIEKAERKKKAQDTATALVDEALPKFEKRLEALEKALGDSPSVTPKSKAELSKIDEDATALSAEIASMEFEPAGTEFLQALQGRIGESVTTPLAELRERARRQANEYSRLNRSVGKVKKFIKRAEDAIAAGNSAEATRALDDAQDEADGISADIQSAEFEVVRSHFDARLAAALADIAAARAKVPQDGKPQPKSEAAPEPLPQGVFPDSIAGSGMKVVNESIGGTTGAKLVEIDGRRYILKTAGKVSADHVRNEAAADRAYRLAGIRVPDCRVYEEGGKTYKLSEFIPGGQTLGDFMAHATPAQKKAVIEELRQGYIVDSLFANWDVLGTAQDNVLIDKDGHAWRIDNGSAFGFRAQGSRKKPEEWERREWPDEWRTLRSASINRGVFDKLTAHDIFSSKVNLDAVAASLPADVRKAIEKPLLELKQMQARCASFDQGGILPEHTSTALEVSYDFAKEGFRQEIPKNISLGNYGFCRDSGLAGKQNPGGLPNYAQVIKEAAISINAHSGFGKSAADYSPNMDKVEKALKFKAELKKHAKTDKNAKVLLGYLSEIEKAQSAGWHISSPISKVQSLTVSPPGVAASAPQNYRSLTDHLYDKAQRDGVDVGVIADYYKAQGDHSWEGHGGVACRLKILNLALRGEEIEIGKLSRDVWNGKNSENNFQPYYQSQIDFYKKHPEKFEADKKALLYWRAATHLLLENASFDGNHPEGQYLFTTRSDDPDFFKGMKNGEVNAAYPIGACESACVVKSIGSIFSGGHVGVRRVPFSRVNGIFFMDGRPEGGEMFLGNNERELSSDMVGLPVFDTGYTGRGYDLGAHDEELTKAFARWDSAVR